MNLSVHGAPQWKGWLRWATLLAFALTLLLSAPASTQTLDPSMEALLEKVSLEGKAFDKSPVPRSTVAEVNLDVHWRLWKRIYAQGKPGEDELTALEHDGRSLGFLNQPVMAMALTGLALSEPASPNAMPLLAGAQDLAPDLPYPYLAEASFVLDHEPAKFHRWGSAWARGLTLGARWPDTAFPWALKLLLYALAAAGAAIMLFILGQLVRQFGIVAFDIARALPRGFSSNQTVVILLAIIIVPGLLLLSPLLSMLILLAFLSVPQRWNERLATAAIFAMIAALPQIDEVVGDLTTYQGSRTQALANAQYVRCDAACRETLEDQLKASPDDYHLRYTVLLAGYRTGDPSALERIVEDIDPPSWPVELRGDARNLRGAALIALARPTDALEVLQEARRELPGSAAPAFNLMRAYQMTDALDDASRALQEASARDMEAVSSHLRLERRDVNSFLLVEPLPLTTFFAYHRQLPREDVTPIGDLWRALAGERIGVELAPVLGGLGLLIVVLGIPMERRGRTSTPCPRCGLARSPEDLDRTGNHRFCLPCYRTFVTGAGLDYEARVYNETVLGRREKLQSMMRRVLSIVAPGAGHHVAGHALTGLLLSWTLVFGALLVARPMGPVRPPRELLSVNWAAQVSLGWLLVSLAVFSALYAAWQDIAPLPPRGGK